MRNVLMASSVVTTSIVSRTAGNVMVCTSAVIKVMKKAVDEVRMPQC